MSVQNLTKWEQHCCTELFDWLVDSVARSITAPKRGRQPSPHLIDHQLAATYGQIWEFYRNTGILGFADATEAFRKAWIHWRVEIGIEPMRRMKLYGSRWRPVGQPFIPARQWTLEKKARSVWIGSRLWLASIVAGTLHKKSSYGHVMSELKQRNAHMTTDSIKVRVCEFRKLLNLHPLNLKTISSEAGQIKLMLLSNDGKALFTVDITRIGSVLKSGVEEVPLEATAMNRAANIKFVSRDQLLLNKAEAFLLRSNLKARDAYDAMDLLAKGASLTGNLKNHLEDMLYGEFDTDRIRERIKQVDAKRCRAELKDKLPDEVYQNLEELDFQPLRDGLTKIFQEWL